MLLTRPRRAADPARGPAGPRRASVALAASLALASVAAAQEPPSGAGVTTPAPGAQGGDAPAPPETSGQPPATAEPGEGPKLGGKPGDGFVEVRLGYYDSTDGRGDGNPFLDESLTVVEPVIVVGVNVTERLALQLKGSYDYVSSASIDRLSRYPEQSGASGDNYFGGDLSARYALTEAVRLGAHAGFGAEYDYQSFGVGGNVEWDLFEKTTTLSLGLNGYLDTVKVIRFDGAEEGDEGRTTLTLNLGWYQILSPALHLSVGASFTRQSGFLETAYNGVVLEDPSDPANPLLDNQARGVEVAEELPDSRLRYALWGELRRHFTTGTAVGLGLRGYTDSWGITSGTVELQVHQWIVDDRLRARLRYRYYRQSAAIDFQDRFQVPPGARAAFLASEERTQDADLGDFDAHTIGLELTWKIGRVSVDLGGDYVLRSDGIDQRIVSLGLRWDF